MIIQFDTKIGKLKCFINDKDMGMDHDNVDINKSYRLAIALMEQCVVVEIIGFNIRPLP